MPCWPRLKEGQQEGSKIFIVRGKGRLNFNHWLKVAALVGRSYKYIYEYKNKYKYRGSDGRARSISTAGSVSKAGLK